MVFLLLLFGFGFGFLRVWVLKAGFFPWIRTCHIKPLFQSTHLSDNLLVAFQIVFDLDPS